MAEITAGYICIESNASKAKGLAGIVVETECFPKASLAAHLTLELGAWTQFERYTFPYPPAQFIRFKLQSLNYRADIDGLRAIAVLAVVFFHAFPRQFAGGFIGVDIFFVISGFLISSILFRGLDSGNFDFLAFYERRIKRIFPALICVLLACYLFSWLALFPDEFARLGKHIAGGAGFVSNLVLLSESGYFDAAAQGKPLLHLWSLGIEEQFYIVWPLFLWICWKARFNLLLCAVVLVLTSFLVNIFLVRDAQTQAFYSPFARFWELLVGGVLAYVQGGRPAGRLSNFNFHTRWQIGSVGVQDVLAILGGLLIVIGFATISEHKPFPGWLALLPVIGTALLISAGNAAWINRVFLSSRPMVWLGLISFPLYLWHWPLLSFLHILNAHSRWWRLTAVLLAVALAYATVIYVEKPLRSSKRRIVAPALLGVMSVMFCIGLATHLLNGIGSRGSIKQFEEARALLSWPSDNNFEAKCVKRFTGSGYCVIARDAPATVALIGDSQANHFFPGLAAQYLAIGENLVNLGCGACPPLINTTSRYEGKTPIGMETMDLVLRTVIQDPKIHTVVLAANWHLYLQGTRFSDESKSWPRWEIRSRENKELTANEKVFELQMSRTIDALQAAGKQLIVIKQIPELNHLPSACLAPRPFSLARQNVECRTPIASVEKYLSEYEYSFDRFFSEKPEIRLLNPDKSLCDSKFCYSMRDSKPLYRDELHLSEFGSLEVAKSFVGKITPVKSSGTSGTR